MKGVAPVNYFSIQQNNATPITIVRANPRLNDSSNSLWSRISTFLRLVISKYLKIESVNVICYYRNGR